MHPEPVLSEAERVLVTLAAGNSHPLIDLDWTVVLQGLLFFAMFLLANRLLFQPYMSLRDKRIAGIDGAKAEAERMNLEADAKLADYQAQLKAARSRAADEQRKIRGEATKHEQQVTEQGRKTAQTALDEAMSRVRRDTAAARAELAPSADLIARQMVKQLLGREVV
jgi:F-type H+-transporting ATPase subunit b